MTILTQSQRALELANEVRFARRDLKLSLRAGELSIIDVIHADFDYIRTAEVGKLLTWQRSIQQFYSNRICTRAGIRPSREFGSLTRGERRRLLDALVELRPRRLAA